MKLNVVRHFPVTVNLGLSLRLCLSFSGRAFFSRPFRVPIQTNMV